MVRQTTVLFDFLAAFAFPDRSLLYSSSEIPYLYEGGRGANPSPRNSEAIGEAKGLCVEIVGASVCVEYRFCLACD